MTGERRAESHLTRGVFRSAPARTPSADGTRRPPPRLAFPILLAAFALLALAYSLTIPLGEAPDEVSHYSYVEYLAAHRQLPAPEGAVYGEAHQPPLYYLIGALSISWVGGADLPIIANPDLQLDDPQTPNLLLHTRAEAFPYHDGALRWHLLRLLSVLMGAITVWATWRSALLIFRGEAWLALCAAALVAFLPEFTFISAVVNNDNLVVMLTALAVLVLLHMGQQPARGRDAALLGLLLGLAALAKLSGLVLWPFAALVLLRRAWTGRERKTAAVQLALCFGVAALVLAPWAIYNVARFGDPLGWSQVLAVTPVRQTPPGFNDWIGILVGLFSSFWGRFGGALQLRPPLAFYAFLSGLALVALSGWILAARDALQKSLDARARRSFLWFALFWLIMLASYVRWTMAVLGTDQARQLFPGLPLLAIFLAAGLGRVFVRLRPAAVGAWTGGLAAMSLAMLLILNASYGSPAAEASALAPLHGAQAPADFGKTIRVVDYAIDRTQVAAGQTLDVRFYWQALEPASAKDYWLLLQLTNADGAVVNKDGVPSGGRVTTDWWQSGQVFVSHHTLRVPDEARPGIYTLQVGLHPFGVWEWLTVRGRDTLALAKITVIPGPQQPSQKP